MGAGAKARRRSVTDGSRLLDAIRDMINEGLVGSTGDHSSCGVGLKGSVSLLSA